MINGVFKVENNNYFKGISDKKNQNYLLSPDVIKNIKQNNENKKHRLGLAIAGGSIIIGLGVFMVLSGIKKPTKLIHKLQNFFQAQIQKTNDLKVGQFYKSCLDKINFYSQKFDCINNFTSIKDIFVKKMMYKSKFTRKIHESVAKIADSASYLTVKLAWNKTQNHFTKLFKLTDKVNETILKSGNADEIITIGEKSLTRKEWVKLLTKHCDTVKSIIEEQTNPKGMMKKKAKINSATKGLDDYIWGKYFSRIANLKDKKNWQNFLADEYIKESKINFTKEMKAIKNKISKTGVDSEGEFQKMLEIYKKLSPDEYKKILKSMNKSITSLDESIDKESVKYFDKMRDLKIGSAMTDLFSILSGVGAVGWGLNRAKNKDERISINLKYGIPAIGAIATSIYCTARMLAGTKSMILGALSGLLFNIIGSKVDEIRLKNHQTP